MNEPTKHAVAMLNLTDKLNDLNAMHEAEEVLDCNQWEQWHRIVGEWPTDLARLSVMHAVYVRDEGQDWQLFSAEPNLECAKTTASVLEVTRPNSDCCILPPNASAMAPADEKTPTKKPTP